MSGEDALLQEVEALRHRLSRLSAASLHINASLDFDTVLQGVLDSARSLTGARYGVLTLDDAGRLQDVFFSGMTAPEAQRFQELPAGEQFFEYLSRLPEPLRVPDLFGHLRSLGLPEFQPPFAVSPAVAFLAAPVLHRGERVGNFYLGEKEAGPAFTAEDEETLVLFASQAALVIANARRFREERQARADLETLIDTSPVGVVVFDAVTGRPKSLNREARRIVDSLQEPDQSPEQLLAVLTVRREDGREISLQEFPLAQLLGVGETVRAEEIVLQAPGDRSVTVLLNATPILAEEGTVASFVVTMQDMAAVEELERLRAEFLATVSHELRTPLTAIKGSVTTLLDPAAALLPAESRQFHRIIDAQTDRLRALISDLLDVARIDAGTLAIAPEPTALAVLVEEARNVFQSGRSRHHLHVDLAPDLPWVLADRQRLVQVLNNLLANAARHADEAAPIRVTAGREGVYVAVVVADEGRGVAAEHLPHLFRKFTRIAGDDRRGELEGTGLGLAICKGIIEAHGGRIWAESDGPGRGARFTFTLPVADQPESAGAASPAPVTARASRHAAADQVRVLVVEDDPQALRYVRDSLAPAGFVPVVTGDPAEVLRLVADEQPHLVLLDLVLPGSDGIELMQQILERADVPVIFLSAYGRDEIVAQALEAGAVDYIVKPFSPTELVARVRAALRQRAAAEPAEPYVLGDLVIDYAGRSVTLAGRPVPLIAIEYRLLAELASHAGHVVPYDQLLRRVWGAEHAGDLRPMRTVVSTLRRKLGDDADQPTYLFTEPRIGYRLARSTTPAPAAGAAER